MTHVVVDPGVCGLAADIRVDMVGSMEAKITVDTDCAMITDLVAGLGETVDPYAVLGMTGEPPLMESGRVGTRIHAACPTIAGIAKAVEVASGMALPKDASITFADD